MCKCILWEDNEHDKYTVNNRLYQHPKEDAHIKRHIENKLIFHNVWNYFNLNNFGTWCLFHLFCCTTQRMFEPLHVYEPSFNTDKYGSSYIKVRNYEWIGPINM